MKSKDVSIKQKYFWNMMGSLCNSFSTMILLLLTNWILGSEAGGIFSFAYANAQMMLIIGELEVHPIQTTDVEEEYSFQTYFTLRVMACIVMMCVSVGYTCLSGFEKEKSWIIIAFSGYKMVEALSDVFGGMYQQNDRIDLTGKTFSLRVVLSTISFGIILFVFHDLLLGALIMVLVSVVLFFLYDSRFICLFPGKKIGFKYEKMGSLIKDVMPLFIAAFIMSYISNAPKYAINTYCSDTLQNKYGILFMPAFIINLFSIFAFRPILVDMTKKWNRRDVAGVVCYIKRSVLFIILVTIICVAGGIIVGIPILSFVYGIDLAGEQLVLAIVMLYGGFTAFSTYFHYVITVMRLQNKILIGYVVSFAFVAICAPVFVKEFELVGAAVTSLIGAIILDAIFVIIIAASIKKRSAGENA